MLSDAANPEHYRTDLHEEVLKSLRDTWAAFAAGDVVDLLKHYDQGFKGFRPEIPFMIDREWMQKWLEVYLKDRKVSILDIFFHHIQMCDENTAVVFYGLSFIEDNGVSKNIISQRHCVTMVRRPKRWTLMASHIENISSHSA